MVKECDKLKTKLQDLISEFGKKRREILSAYDGQPDINLVLRKEDWLLVKILCIELIFIGKFGNCCW